MELPKKQRVVVMIPTYNERENIGGLITKILELPLDCQMRVLVADDDSPDGTGTLVEEMAKTDPRIQALVRKKRRGRGASGIDGFKATLALDPDYVIEMDGDFSHQPQFIPTLLDAAKTYDLVLGSRYVKGAKDANRNFVRRLITFFVRIFIRRLYHLPVKDVSSGFRCFRREVLEAVDLDDLISVGQSIVLEILYKAFLLGFSIGETPIDFIDREKGQTKLNFLALFETLVMAIKFKERYTRAGLSAKH
jgi:dolichol-phosphate mannosyltransferase